MRNTKQLQLLVHSTHQNKNLSFFLQWTLRPFKPNLTNRICFHHKRQKNAANNATLSSSRKRVVMERYPRLAHLESPSKWRPTWPISRAASQAGRGIIVSGTSHTALDTNAGSLGALSALLKLPHIAVYYRDMLVTIGTTTVWKGTLFPGLLMCQIVKIVIGVYWEKKSVNNNYMWVIKHVLDSYK